MNLFFILFERIALLLVVAFALSRLRIYQRLLDRSDSWRMQSLHAVLFGCLGILGIEVGVLLTDGQMTPHGWLWHLQGNQVLVGPSLVVIVIAGLFGGPAIGFWSGLWVGLFTFWLGGEQSIPDVIVQPLVGALSGWTARVFSEERVISAQKAIFVGMFAPVLHMAVILMLVPPKVSVGLVNAIGLPLVVTNSVAIGLFTVIIRLALGEQEHRASIELQRALSVAERALPFLRDGLTPEGAAAVVRVIHERIHADAVSMASVNQLLAYEGIGGDHHLVGESIQTQLARSVLETGQTQIARRAEEISCRVQDCPIQAAVMVPLWQSGSVVGLVTMMFTRPDKLGPIEQAMAEGMGQLISHQLDAVESERLRRFIQDARLRQMQSQMNPHFLFNTLQMIAALIRRNPDRARHTITQLGQVLRSGLRAQHEPLVSVEQEIAHLQAYVDIVKVRFEDRLHVHIAMDDDAKKETIPAFSLQPIVENSIKFALQEDEKPLSVSIGIHVEGAQVRVTVSDTGPGFPSTVLEWIGIRPVSTHHPDGGQGLYNVNQRLIGYFGNSAQLHVENHQSNGCSVWFELPMAIARKGWT